MVSRHTRRSFFFLFCHSRAISIAPNFSAHSYQHRRRQPTVENGWAALPFPKWIKYLFFFHRNILFRLDKTFRIHIFIRFWEFRWLNFSSHSVMCDIFIFFFFSCASCLSLCVYVLFLLSVVCYRDHTLSLSELKFLLFIKFFFFCFLSFFLLIFIFALPFCSVRFCVSWVEDLCAWLPLSAAAPLPSSPPPVR